MSTSGEQAAEFGSFGAVVSADGRFVAFTSGARDLVEGDTDAFPDVFIHDRQTGTTEIQSVNSEGEPGDGHSRVTALSPNGRYVLIWSLARNLASDDTFAGADVFLRDLRPE